jgi:hypothetical protein
MGTWLLSIPASIPKLQKGCSCERGGFTEALAARKFVEGSLLKLSVTCSYIFVAFVAADTSAFVNGCEWVGAF